MIYPKFFSRLFLLVFFCSENFHLNVFESFAFSGDFLLLFSRCLSLLSVDGSPLGTILLEGERASVRTLLAFSLIMKRLKEERYVRNTCVSCIYPCCTLVPPYYYSIVGLRRIYAQVLLYSVLFTFGVKLEFFKRSIYCLTPCVFVSDLASYNSAARGRLVYSVVIYRGD